MGNLGSCHANDGRHGRQGQQGYDHGRSLARHRLWCWKSKRQAKTSCTRGLGGLTVSRIQTQHIHQLRNLLAILSFLTPTVRHFPITVAGNTTGNSNNNNNLFVNKVFKMRTGQYSALLKGIKSIPYCKRRCRDVKRQLWCRK